MIAAQQLQKEINKYVYPSIEERLTELETLSETFAELVGCISRKSQTGEEV